MRSTLERHCRRGRGHLSQSLSVLVHVKSFSMGKYKSTVITKDNSVASTFHEIFSTDPGAPLLVSY